MTEWIAIGVSAIALVVAMISAFASITLQRFDSRRSTREQLVEIVREMIKLNAESHSLWFVSEEDRDPQYYYRLGTTSQVAASLARHAVYLTSQYPDQVSDVEYHALAQTLVLAGDPAQAEVYWQRAIEASSNDFYRVVNTRMYADYLFRQGRYDEGRRQYASVLRVEESDSDTQKMTNAFTCQMWMVNEIGEGFPENGEHHRRRAESILRSVSVAGPMASALEGLRLAHETVSRAVVSPAPVGPPTAGAPGGEETSAPVKGPER